MRDLISRQAAIDEVLAWLKDSMSDKKNGKPLTDRLKELPSAQPVIMGVIDESGRIKFIEQPEQKKGKWIKKSKPIDYCTLWWYECSECGSKPLNDNYGHANYLSNFCPNCGAKMEVEG